MSWSGGSSATVETLPNQWTRVEASLPVPSGAVSAETVVNVTGTAENAPVLVTQHDVRAPVATPPPTTAIMVNLPAQAAGVTYGSASGALPYAHPGGLVIAGRDNYQGEAFKEVSAAGGTCSSTST